MFSQIPRLLGNSKNLKHFADKFKIPKKSLVLQDVGGVMLGEHHVKVPYKLLLTRLSSSLDLTMAEQKVSIFFRIEPVRDMPEVTQKTL